MMNVALILSGGIGTRLGADEPKQYIQVGDRPVFAYCLQQIMACESIHAVQIVADSQWQDLIRKWVQNVDHRGIFKGFSEPGETRQLSIFNGLEDISQYAEESSHILIHDAARPLLTEDLIRRCLDAMNGYDGVIPVLPMKDTVYRSVDGKQISSLLKREEIFAGQAPEVFVLGKYLEANRRLLPDEILRVNGSTEAAIMSGMKMAMIPGEEANFKITTKEDLIAFENIVKKNGEISR